MILIILIISLVLRLIELNQSLWLDEAINIVNAKSLPFLEFVTKYPIGDFHPPGYFTILWIWIRLFGFSEIAVRIPSVLFGVATVWIVYLLGKELVNRKAGLVAAILLSVAPLHVYYSQEARMYVLVALAVSLSWYFLIQIISKKKFAIWGYVASMLLILSSDYIAYFILPAQLIFILWEKHEFFKKIIMLQVISLLPLILWLPIFNQQLETGKAAAMILPNWAQVVGGGTMKNVVLLFVKTIVGRISFDNKLMYGLAVVLPGTVYGFLFLRTVRKLTWQIKLLLCWIVLPIVLALLISIFIPVFSYFRMLFLLPAVYLLTAKGLDNLPKKYFNMVLAFLIISSLFFLGIFYISPQFQREDWRNAVATVERKAGSNGVILFEDNNIPAPFTYYSKNTAQVIAAFSKVPAATQSDIKDLSGIRRIFLFEYLIDINDSKRLLQKSLESSGFKKVDTYNFNGVGFVHLYSL